MVANCHISRFPQRWRIHWFWTGRYNCKTVQRWVLQQGRTLWTVRMKTKVTGFGIVSTGSTLPGPYMAVRCRKPVSFSRPRPARPCASHPRPGPADPSTPKSTVPLWPQRNAVQWPVQYSAGTELRDYLVILFPGIPIPTPNDGIPSSLSLFRRKPVTVSKYPAPLWLVLCDLCWIPTSSCVILEIMHDIHRLGSFQPYPSYAQKFSSTHPALVAASPVFVRT